MQIIFLFTSLLLVFVQPQMEAGSGLLPEQMHQSNPADYVGTWVGHTPDGEFTIVLKERKKYRLSNGKDYDVIVGKHSYVTSKSNVKNESLSKPESYFALFGVFNPDAPRVLLMGFIDNVNRKNIQVSLTFDTNSSNKLRWQVVGERETMTLNARPDQLPIRGVSVPTDLILLKVE